MTTPFIKDIIIIQTYDNVISLRSDNAFNADLTLLLLLS